MNSFTLSLPLLALIAIFASSALKSGPQEIVVLAPSEFTRIYKKAKARYQAATPTQPASPAALCEPGSGSSPGSSSRADRIAQRSLTSQAR